MIVETGLVLSEVGESVELTPDCGIKNDEGYRVKVQVECNYDKIKALPWRKTSHIIASEMFTLRAGQDGRGVAVMGGVQTSQENHWFQLFVGRPYTDIDVLAFGDDVRGGSSLFLSEGDCTEGEFMNFVIEQVHYQKLISID